MLVVLGLVADGIGGVEEADNVSSETVACKKRDSETMVRRMGSSGNLAESVGEKPIR